MKLIIVAIACLIPTVSFGFTKVTLKQYSASGTNPAMSCAIMTTSDDSGIKEAGTKQYVQPGAVYNRNLRGVTKKYSSAYFVPSANDKYATIVCFPTATGPSTTSTAASTSIPSVNVSFDSSTATYPISKDFMLKCH